MADLNGSWRLLAGIVVNNLINLPLFLATGTAPAVAWACNSSWCGVTIRRSRHRESRKPALSDRASDVVDIYTNASSSINFLTR